jgi:hypothetical protein
VTATETNDVLISVAPTEEVGRETLSRYDMQFQAAAFAALEILEGGEVVCVYCDYHDDFVVKRKKGDLTHYHFFQVKTKGKLNHQWSLLEVLAVKKKGQTTDDDALKKVRSSFIGKLIDQGVRFGDACLAVTLLSNVHFHDDVVTVVEEWQARKGDSKPAKILVDNFSRIFGIKPELDEAVVRETLAKVTLEPGVGYIGQDRERFVNASRSAIYKFSEIDLDFFEITDLANNLLDTVYQRSKGSLAAADVKALESRVGIVLDDLLRVLSISPSAYRALLGGEDAKVIKTASILQRVLTASGATPAMIEFASVQKVSWDVWFRNARHTYGDLDLAFLLQKLDETCRKWRLAGASFDDLDGLIEQCLSAPSVAKFAGLTRELIFGGTFAALVRSSAK